MPTIANVCCIYVQYEINMRLSLYPRHRGTFYYLRFITCNPCMVVEPHDDIYTQRCDAYIRTRGEATKVPRCENTRGKFMFNVQNESLTYNENFLNIAYYMHDIVFHQGIKVAFCSNDARQIFFVIYRK